MELLTSIAIFSSGLLGLLVVALFIFAIFGPPGNAKPLLLEQALRRQGDDVARRASASGSHDFAMAVQRCLACNEAAECRAWLSSGAREGFEHFCPNRGYIERMKR
jgi:hypothetical protein